MIESLRIKNFKRFRELTLPLRPLTVLTGLNGAGKTSLLHALLLARQACSSPVVHLNGPYCLQLGDALDVLYVGVEPAEGISIEIIESAEKSHAFLLGVDEERSLNLSVKERPAEPPSFFSENGRYFTYLCAERLGPRDVLGADSTAIESLGVGTQGEYTAQVLAMLDRMKLPVRTARIHPNTGTDTGLLRDQAERWASSIIRPIQIEARWVDQANVTTIRYKVPGKLEAQWTRPPNMGFGVSYGLPIIVAGLLAPEGALLLVENPEAHLHPAGQSAMGAFLARVAADGVQVVLETHSDHVINGIRRAVVEEKKLSASNAIVHFFGASEDGAAGVIPIEVAATGSLSAWPAGFFDQIETDLAALSRARRPK